MEAARLRRCYGTLVEADESPEPCAESQPGSPLLVQRADTTGACLALEYRLPGLTEQVMVASLGGKSIVGVVTLEERKAAWGGGRLPAETDRKKAWEGARISLLGESQLVLQVRDATLLVRAQGARLQIQPADGHLPTAATDARLRENGKRILAELPAALLHDEKARARELLLKARVRLKKRIEAVRSDLAKIRAVQELVAFAPWFIAEAAKLGRGTKELRVTDWATDPPSERVLQLDPAKLPKEQVAAIFARAKRMKQGAEIANARLAAGEAVLERIDACAIEIDAATEAPTVRDAMIALRKQAPKDIPASGHASSAKKGKGLAAQSLPFRTFRDRTGHVIRVGKNAEASDELTLHLSKPTDLWLHAKEHKGAHVLVGLGKGQSCPPHTLVAAAHLAAHFSDARGETVVDVQYTDRRFLRKPKGSAKGFVVVTQEKVLVLRLEPALLTELLASEET